MKQSKNKTYIYGFEEHNVLSFLDNILVQKYDLCPPYYFESSGGRYIINKDLPAKAVSTCVASRPYLEYVDFEPALCENHKELLPTAKKLYVHPSCKLSRSMMAEKYGKSIDPFLSDAVVIPKPNYDDFYMNKEAIFVNESEKIVLHIRIDSDIPMEIAKTFKEGDRLGDFLNCNVVYSGYMTPVYNIGAIAESRFVYFGELLFIPNTHSYAFDILTHTLPADKIVFEESVQESLSDESNQLTFDSLTSIKDMLDSSDENTVAAGLKSLSMMDWVHYPNSIKFILNQANYYRWRCNAATNSTSVKYMLNTISDCSYRRGWPGEFTEKIYEEDYELFKELKMHYDHLEPDTLMQYICTYNFMACSSEGVVSPRLKQRI